jgi:putative transposase
MRIHDHATGESFFSKPWLRGLSPAWLSKIAVVEGDKTRHRFWQPGGGYDRNIDREGTLESMIEHIHQNPVRRGLVGQAEQWEWSSARWYAGIRPIVLDMDRLSFDTRTQ